MVTSMQSLPLPQVPAKAPVAKDAHDPQAREAFRQFVGETVFSQLLSSMRKTVDKPAYLHGGRAEEVFQGQLDQQLSAEIAKTSADRFADPMFELFMMQQRS
jgi:flagellar protein FlgJ